MRPLRSTCAVIVTALLMLAGMTTVSAQILLYAQRLPEGTVYIRFANALPAAASLQTDFAGRVDLGADGAARISPYFVAETAGSKKLSVPVSADGKTTTATFTPKSGTFITVVLHPSADGVTAAIVTDKPEFNQLKARLTFYNATPDCAGGALAEGNGRAVFSAVPANAAQARSINPVSAVVTASCATGKVPPLDLGKLTEGGLYSVWMMQPADKLTAFLAHDTIAPPRS